MVHVLVTARGNEFMLDIASMVVDGMRAIGVPCELGVDSIPEESSSGHFQLVVAPHEYFPLFLQRAIESHRFQDAVSRTHVLNVEQPGSPWFEDAARFAGLSRGVFDISPEGVSEFRRRGVDAVHSPLGLAGVVARPTVPMAVRTTDIVFLGYGSARRQQFFAEHADVFSRYSCRFFFVDVSRPRQITTPGYVSSQARSAILSNSRILLNVHSTDRSYFESHRALLALSHGCALVTEASVGTEPLVNGKHFLMAPAGELAARAVELLADPQRLAEVANAGHELARTELRMEDTCRAMLAHAEASSSKPAISFEDDRLRREVRDRLKTSQALRSAGEADWTVETNRAAESLQSVSVSVVVTAFNYAPFLAQCLESVLASQPPANGFEVVVVDDASVDDSVGVARKAMDCARVPVRLVRKHRNTGLADSRNVGTELSRGAFVLTLDADNWLYPSCLRVLSEALSQHQIAAAYPILRRFQDGSNQPAGLLSLYPWSVRELVRGPYIDALAMFRRDALLAAGGYSTELIDHGWFGWEDYDLWLKLADAGGDCVQIPQVLASYRVHADSMISRTNRNSEAIARYLRKKFSRLERAHPDLDRCFGFAANDVWAGGTESGSVTDELRRSQQDRLQLQQQLREMYASWSWRITGPLRAVYRLLTWPIRSRAKER